MPDNSLAYVHVSRHCCGRHCISSVMSRRNHIGCVEPAALIYWRRRDVETELAGVPQQMWR